MLLSLMISQLALKKEFPMFKYTLQTFTGYFRHCSDLHIVTQVLMTTVIICTLMYTQIVPRLVLLEIKAKYINQLIT